MLEEVDLLSYFNFRLNLPENLEKNTRSASDARTIFKKAEERAIAVHPAVLRNPSVQVTH